MEESPLITEAFIDFILPSKEVILRKPNVNYEYNNILFKNILIIGFPGSGKTTAVNYIASKAVERYGRKNVNIRFTEIGNLGALIHWGLKPTLVNILFADNVTLYPPNRETLIDYLRIGHVYHRRFNRNNGYILSILALHRYHSIPVELRTTIDGIIIKDSTLNPYDRSVLKRFLDAKSLKFLEEIAVERDKNPELKSFAFFVGKGLRGLVSLPLVSKNYLKPAIDLKELAEFRNRELSKKP